MEQKIKTGVKGLDELLGGGIPENTVTLLYGPPKTGKSIFCAQFLSQGLKDNQPCLYTFTDYDTGLLLRMTSALELDIKPYLQKEMVYRIDLSSSLGGTAPLEQPTLKVTSVTHLSEFMFKAAEGFKAISIKNPSCRAILDSVTTLFLYNEPVVILRLMKAWGRFVKASGATGLIVYTEGATDPKTEIMLKGSVDNIIRLSENMKISVEAMMGFGRAETKYSLKDSGIVVCE